MTLLMIVMITLLMVVMMTLLMMPMRRRMKIFKLGRNAAAF